MFVTLQQYVPVVLDILLITFLFYKTYMLVRGTRIAQVAQLLAWIVGAAFLAQILRLYTVAWVLDRLWLWIVVLLIVLFQSEAKQIVVRLAYRSRFFGSAPVEMRRFVEQVADAIARLALRGEGGTLVIERDDSMEDLIDSGVRIEALFSHELLIAIYAEDSPLRDGAVVIRNRRIVSASCLLPIPDEGKLSTSSLGFRHLSAITLSQGTDAVIIVASAETGMISLAVDGQWQRELDKDKLEEALTDYLILGTDRAERS